MADDTVKVQDTRQWLVKARADLDAARILLEAGREMPGVAAFHCQQAAEKAMKAFLYWHDVPFRKTHALEEVGSQCLAIDRSLETVIQAVMDLTPYAWRFRYPGDMTEPSADEVRSALSCVQSLYREVLLRLPGVVDSCDDTPSRSPEP